MSHQVTGDPAPVSHRPAVYIVDDDRAMRSSVVMSLRADGINARAFASAEDFLEELAFLATGCVLLDIRMPGMSGLDLLAELRRRDCHWPVVVITGHGEINLAVRAVKLGAIDFLEKPYCDEDLQPILEEAFAKLELAKRKSQSARAARQAFAKLSPRERQVFERVTAGKSNKEVAAELNLSPRTVESYRFTMMAKLGAEGLHGLIAIANERDKTS